MNNTLEMREKINDLRILWIILIAIFTAVIFLNLYKWNDGGREIGGVLAPLGMIFVGLGQISHKRHKLMYYAFTGMSLILFLLAMVVLAIY
jgi:hypothetical protein